MTAGAVAIVVDRDPMPWSPTDAEGPGLGGSELAVTRVASGLVRRGRRVTVYANLREEEIHSGACYERRSAFRGEEQRAAVIACRAFELLDSPPAADTTLLWVHTPDAGSALTEGRTRALDHLLALSAWHADRLRSAHPFAARKIKVVRNGVDPVPARGPRALRVLSTSQPERGLDVLLELWPQVRARVPEAELVCVWAPVYDHIESRNAGVASHRQRVRALARQPGVRLLGPVPRPRLVDLLSCSRVWAHPSWSTSAGLPFEEISCIAAMEAQAAGLWVVASAIGALPETVGVGALVDAGDAPGAAWRERLAAEIVRGLVDSDTRARAEREGPAAVRALGWDGVAEAMDGLIRRRAAA